MKQLFRSKNDKIICGVCGGIGEYFNVDANAVRIGAVLLGCTGAGIIAYIVAAFIVPENDQQ